MENKQNIPIKKAICCILIGPCHDNNLHINRGNASLLVNIVTLRILICMSFWVQAIFCQGQYLQYLWKLWMLLYPFIFNNLLGFFLFFQYSTPQTTSLNDINLQYNVKGTKFQSSIFVYNHWSAEKRQLLKITFIVTGYCWWWFPKFIMIKFFQQLTFCVSHVLWGIATIKNTYLPWLNYTL